jgi:hypothetical protein
MKSPKEIAAALIAAPHLTEEVLADLDAYRGAKRATGAPVELEYAVARAAYECQAAADALRKYLDKAVKEATANAAYIAEHGVRFGEQTWFTLDDRTSAESLNRALRVKREHFQAVLGAWAAIADRIVATPDEQVKAAAERMQRETDKRIASWSTLPVKRLRDFAKSRDIDHTGDKEVLIQRLVDAGFAATAQDGAA